MPERRKRVVGITKFCSTKNERKSAAQSIYLKLTIEERSLIIYNVGMNEIKREFREKMLGFITAAFGLVAGLAWNDAIKSAIEEFIPAERSGIAAKFLYAFLVTIILVVVTIYLMKLFRSKNEGDI